jgi:SAM-dependent methyltransferase
MPSEQELAILYTTDEASISNSDSWIVARDYEASPHTIQQYYRRSRINWLEREGYLSSESTAVLDIGCSTGMFLRTMKDIGYTNLQGVDLSPLHCEYVERAHGIHCHSSIDAVPAASFDLVTCYAVLEHTTDPIGFLKQVTEKLRPGGHALILVPNYRSFYKAISGRHWLWLIPPVHLQYFGPKSLDRAFERSGLTVSGRRSGYGGTYVYIAVHHLTQLLGLTMPSTRRTGRSGQMMLLNTVERAIRAVLFPISRVATMMLRHNELTFIGTRPS